MGDQDTIVEFEDAFDSVSEDAAMAPILSTLDAVLDLFLPHDAVVLDIRTFTKPYTLQVDPDGRSVYQKVVARGLVPIILSWEADSEENMEAERAKLTSWGVSPDVALILRDPEACPHRKKGCSFAPDMCAYTQSRVLDLGHTIVMYVGRLWIDVLPPDLEETALPGVTLAHHALFRHTRSGVWSLRMSPNKEK
jgi:hypothetical protein